MNRELNLVHTARHVLGGESEERKGKREESEVGGRRGREEMESAKRLVRKALTKMKS